MNVARAHVREVGRRLHRARVARRVSIGDVAAHCSVTTQRVVDWERGLHRLTYEDLVAIAEVLDGLDLHWLLTGVRLTRVGEDDLPSFGTGAAG